jgi:hypothetical protein
LRLPAKALEHDPEKWKPAFGKSHARSKGWITITIRLNVIVISSAFVFLGVAKSLYLFAFTQFRTENRFPLFLESLYLFAFTQLDGSKNLAVGGGF